MKALTALTASLVLALWVGPALAQPADQKCDVQRKEFIPGGMSTATMVMVNNGRPCRFRFKFGGQNAPDSWELVTKPQSGTVQFSEDVAEYLPNPQFTGTDKFVVAVFGRVPGGRQRESRNGRFEIEVTVK